MASTDITLQNMANAAVEATLLSNSRASEINHAEQKANKAKTETSSAMQNNTQRLHTAAASRKNDSWANFFVKAAATETAIAGYLQYAQVETTDAEYFFNFVPKAVEECDIVYKNLLAVYNALRQWTGRNGPIKHVENVEAHKLLHKAKVKGKLGPQKVLILQEINETCRRSNIEMRIGEQGGEESIESRNLMHHLLRSEEPIHRQAFKTALAFKSRARPHTTKETIFPPEYI